MVELRRIKEGLTRIKTNCAYLVNILHLSNIVRHERTSKLYSYFTVDRNISDIPHNIYIMSAYFRNEIKNEGGVGE